MSRTVQYGLRVVKTGELCTFYTSSNEGGDFCGDTQYHLSTGDERPWLVPDRVTAEYVRRNSTEWYNAGYESPTHSFKASELEVVEVVMEVKAPEEELQYPSLREYLEFMYPDNQAHRDYVLSQKDVRFTLYDLREYFRRKTESTSR